ncbi:energy transducer TonB [Olivibacter sp. SDN3]|uniref:energy transducer TonB n=1 Tax=Olivibacter sp. SDN3 TaxID=2764720 RepID=UPI00165196E6|nr:energy transducer TonB [Olivibacter sp. SDN3]QNL52134.1 energy transducer TonB [Olivibacter sp. SDN3]
MNSHRQDHENNYPKAFAISSGIFGAFLILCFFWMLNNPAPEFGMGGLIVNYGTDDEGMGDDYMSLEEPSVNPNANKTLPDKVVPNEEPTPVVSQQTNDKTVVTQDVEDAPEVVTKENVKPSSTTPTVTPEKKESKPTVNPNALYTGKKKDGSGIGDGTGTTAGNQGSLQGNNMAANYGEGGSGNGLVGLPNRSFAVRPEIEDKGQLAGRVAVEITVDRNGNVTRARAGAKGTTLSDATLWEKCETAVRNARLNATDGGPDLQSGIVVFNFKVK